MDLGTELEAVAFEEGIESVADYLCLDAFTPAQPLLDAGRARPQTKGQLLRTFAITRRESISAETLQAVTSSAVSQVLASWLGEEKSASHTDPLSSEQSDSLTNPLVHGAVQLVGRLRLDLAGLSSMCRALLEAHLGDSPEPTVRRLLGADQACSPDLNTALARVGELFSLKRLAEESFSVTHMRSQSLEQLVEPLSAKLTSELRTWLLERLETQGEWILGARRAAVWFVDHLQAMQTTLEQRLAASRELIESKQPSQGRPAFEQVVDDGVQRLHQLLDLAAVSAALGIVSDLRRSVRDAEKSIAEVTIVLANLRNRLPEPNGPADGLINQISETATALLESIETTLLPSEGGIAGVARDEASAMAFGEALLRLAEPIAARTSWSRRDSQTSADNPVEFASLSKRLTAHGANVWRLAAVPASSETASQGQRDANPPCVKVVGLEGTSLFLVEAADLPTACVGVELIGRRRDYATLGSRVHVRKDIQWCDLTEMLDPDLQTAPAPTLSAQAGCTQAVEIAPVAAH